MNRKKFQERLRDARLNMGLTQRDAANKIGMGYGYLGSLERGTVDAEGLTLRKLSQIADAYGVSMCALIDDCPPSPDWLENLTPERRTDIEVMARIFDEYERAANLNELRSILRADSLFHNGILRRILEDRLGVPRSDSAVVDVPLDVLGAG